eukprot:357482-Chlamydomonas_euryale.AAC.6
MPDDALPSPRSHHPAAAMAANAAAAKASAAGHGSSSGGTAAEHSPVDPVDRMLMEMDTGTAPTAAGGPHTAHSTADFASAQSMSAVLAALGSPTPAAVGALWGESSMPPVPPLPPPLPPQAQLAAGGGDAEQQLGPDPTLTPRALRQARGTDGGAGIGSNGSPRTPSVIGPSPIQLGFESRGPTPAPTLGGVTDAGPRPPEGASPSVRAPEGGRSVARLSESNE